MKQMSNRLITVQEAEAMTGRRACTWRKDIRERRIPSVRIGRQIRIPLEAIQELIARGYQPAVNGSERGSYGK